MIILRRRVANRLLGAFLLAALIPLVVSDWISYAAVRDLTSSLAEKNRSSAVRQAGRQVFDRLLAAKAVLTSLNLSHTDPASARAALVGEDLMFRDLIARAEPPPTAPSAPTLGERWALCATSAVFPSTGKVPVALCASANPGGAPVSLLLASGALDGPDWIGEINGDFLWSPIVSASDELDWRVIDAAGIEWISLRNGVVLPSSGRPAGGPDGVNPTRSVIFMRAEFGASDWSFIANAPIQVVRWQGLPLATWLSLVAVATLLMISLASLRLIRRVLAPLRALNQGTLQLAEGIRSTRVAVVRADEFGELASAFNTMAARIDAQWAMLEGFALLDRDILEQKPVHQIAETILRQLAIQYPGARIAFAWIDSDDRLVLCTHDGQSSGQMQVERMLTLDEARAFRVLAEDLDSRSLALMDLPERPLLLRESLLRLVVQSGGNTVAAIEIALQNRSAIAPQAALEVRDRLAVALAARERERELVHRAMHDSLTGLASRFALHAKIEEVIGQRRALSVALLLIDLDYFKNVNDTRGHSVGDELLCHAAARLREAATSAVMVARQGGDEFAVLLHRSDISEVQACAQRVIVALAKPFDLSVGSHVLGASIGVAFAPQHAENREDLIRCADIALYAAKAAGRGRSVLFTSALDEMARRRGQLETDLRLAITRSEFEMYYQPRVSAVDGSTVSAEALIRWNHPSRGILMPDTFIPLAESIGLIDDIGRWVLRAVCSDMSEWQRAGFPLDNVSVNMSAAQLASGELLSHLRSALGDHGLSATALEFEITESVMVGDVDHAFTQLTQFRALGVSIALDDFGTGYSSMAMLARLPLDVLKIDRSFVAGMLDDPRVLAIVQAIAAIAAASHLTLVAEGVETLAQANELRSIGCDQLQGYYFGQPVPARVFGATPP